MTLRTSFVVEWQIPPPQPLNGNEEPTSLLMAQHVTHKQITLTQAKLIIIEWDWFSHILTIGKVLYSTMFRRKDGD
jgi:hypothetical protein